MKTQPLSSQICAPLIVVSRDQLRAMLRVPACSPQTRVTFEAMAKLVADHELPIDQTVEALLREVVVRFEIQPRDMYELIAEGIAPRSGHTGSIIWVPQYHPDREHHPAAEEGEAVNYYEQSPFRVVEADEHVATLLPPRPGRCGTDVFGKPLAAPGGEAYRLVVDDSIHIHDDGRIVTCRAGLLEQLDEHHLRVAPILNVPQNVDFSTGNIRFDGSVFVGGDVLDNFRVECTGNCQVAGTIEAAHVNCGGELRANCGIVGKETGRISVGANAWARYLDGVQGEVRGRLAVTREIINSQLTVHGDLEIIGGAVTGGAIIGGQIVTRGAVRARTLGSTAGVTTTLRLGYVPDLTEAMADHARDIAHVESQIANYRQSARDEKDPDRRAELRMRLTQLETERGRLICTRAALRRKFELLSCVDLNVATNIHHGVRLVLPDVQIHIIGSIPGPIRLRLDENRKPRFENLHGKPLACDDCIRMESNGE